MIALQLMSEAITPAANQVWYCKAVPSLAGEITNGPGTQVRLPLAQDGTEVYTVRHAQVLMVAPDGTVMGDIGVELTPSIIYDDSDTDQVTPLATILSSSNLFWGALYENLDIEIVSANNGDVSVRATITAPSVWATPPAADMTAVVILWLSQATLDDVVVTNTAGVATNVADIDALEAAPVAGLTAEEVVILRRLIGNSVPEASRVSTARKPTGY